MSLEKPKVTLYWLDKSRAQRFVWLLEECDVNYDIEVFKRTPEMMAPPELKKVHPLGKSPVVGVHVPGKTEPVILAESGFITEYLAEHFAPRLVPQKFEAGKEGPGLETESWLRYRFYMHYAEGSLMALSVSNLLFGFLKGDKIPFLIRPLTKTIATRVEDMYFKPNFKTHFSFLESQLATSPNGGEYLCGKELTAVDILMSFPLQAGRHFGFLTAAEYPKVYAYLAKLEDEEGWKKSVTKIEAVTGEPYENKI